MPGFLGTRASLMLDVVFLAMFAVVPILFWSIYLVRAKRNYRLHKQVQVTLSLVLLVAVTLFEVDMRCYTPWRRRRVRRRRTTRRASLKRRCWFISASPSRRP
ncbi:MAG: hypothetical protein QM775_12715 [Pirellulales bacterium]